MNGEERRKKIAETIGCEPVSATKLAEAFGVSRQVIVQDVALLRAEGADILSTNRGYVASKNRRYARVFKVRHSDAQTEEELYLIVDAGGRVDDVFVHHKAYGTISAEMNIDSRAKARAFMQTIACGKSALLKNITSDYHYHTVTAESEETLDAIGRELRAKGFLVEPPKA